MHISSKLCTRRKNWCRRKTMNHYQPFPICLRFWIVSLKMFLSWVCLRKNKYPGVQRCVFLWWLDNTPVPIRTFNENYSFWKFLWKYYRLTDWWRTDTASNRDARMHLMTTLFHLTNHLGKVPKQNAPFLTFLWKPDGHSLTWIIGTRPTMRPGLYMNDWVITE